MRLLRTVTLVAALGSFIAGGVGIAAGAPVNPAARQSNPGATANKHAAHRDARKLLAETVLPAGATVTAADPSAGRHLRLAAFASATPALVDRHEFVRVAREDPSDVVLWFQSHAPAGSTVNMSGAGGGPGYSISSLGFAFPAVTGVLTSRAVAVEITAARGGGTAVRIDAEDVWFVPRPKSERVPSGVAEIGVTIHEFSQTTGHTTTTTQTVTDAAKVAQIVKLVNELAPGQPGTEACPDDVGPYVTLNFRRTPDGAPVASANADGSGCGGISFKLHGKTEPYLSGGDTFVEKLSKMLGFTDAA